MDTATRLFIHSCTLHCSCCCFRLRHLRRSFFFGAESGKCGMFSLVMTTSGASFQACLWDSGLCSLSAFMIYRSCKACPAGDGRPRALGMGARLYNQWV